MIALYGDGFEKVLTWKRFDSSLPGLESLPSEAEMLLRFRELVDEYKPDMIVGYYSDGFDLLPSARAACLRFHWSWD